MCLKPLSTGRVTLNRGTIGKVWSTSGWKGAGTEQGVSNICLKREPLGAIYRDGVLQGYGSKTNMKPKRVHQKDLPLEMALWVPCACQAPDLPEDRLGMGRETAGAFPKRFGVFGVRMKQVAAAAGDRQAGLHRPPFLVVSIWVAKVSLFQARGDVSIGLARESPRAKAL